MLDEHGYGDNGTSAAQTREPSCRCQQVEKQNGQIAHRTIVPTSWNRQSLSNLGIRRAQAAIVKMKSDEQRLIYSPTERDKYRQPYSHQGDRGTDD